MRHVTYDCVVTCPHWHRGECDQKNDPFAFEVARSLLDALHASPDISLVYFSATHEDRDACDRNRDACRMTPLPPSRVLVDVHSFPASAKRSQPYLLLPTQKPPPDALLSLLPEIEAMPGGENAIVNHAAQNGAEAILVEVPYDVKDGCTYTPRPYGALVTTLAKAVATRVAQLKQIRS